MIAWLYLGQKKVDHERTSAEFLSVEREGKGFPPGDLCAQYCFNKLRRRDGKEDGVRARKERRNLENPSPEKLFLRLSYGGERGH